MLTKWLVVQAVLTPYVRSGHTTNFAVHLLRTPDAARALGRSQQYLKRLRESHGGFLVLGTHYFQAPSRNAAITWDVEAINQELCRRAVIDRKKLADG